jgi:Zn finger protein HypA/HybF involved in hydrogenase expression
MGKQPMETKTSKLYVDGKENTKHVHLLYECAGCNSLRPKSSLNILVKRNGDKYYVCPGCGGEKFIIHGSEDDVIISSELNKG